jgi:heat shock protein HslJ
MSSDATGAGARLVGGSYRVVEIDGAPALDRPRADFSFGEDGRVTGCATVNRVFGPYEVDGDILRCGALAGTMMAGPPEAMEQEQRLHRALSQPLTVVPDDAAGRVVLRGADAVVVLERADVDSEM